jgi:hypothetical protein
MKTTTRSRTATIRFSPENLAAAEKVAALTGRTVSSLAEYALVLFMQKNYPLAFSPNATLALKLDEAPALPCAQGQRTPYIRPVFQEPQA